MAEVLVKMPTSREEYDLTLIGNTKSLNELEKELANLHINDIIAFTGFVIDLGERNSRLNVEDELRHPRVVFFDIKKVQEHDEIPEDYLT